VSDTLYRHPRPPRPRHSFVLAVAALGLVALVAGAAWWIAEPAAAPSAAIEPESVEPESRVPADDLAENDLADPLTQERELAPVVAVPDSEPEAATQSDAPAHRASVTVLLLDAATSEPLPDYRFELIDSRRQRVQVVTDAEGKFEAALHAGSLRARFSEVLDRQWVDAGELRFGVEGGVEPLVLRVASGPTYRLAITSSGAVPSGELRARLRARGTEGPVHASGSVHDAPVMWTRFGPIEAATEPEARLTIESADGVLRGTTQVALGPGVRPGVVEVTLNALCAVEVRLLDPEGEPLRQALVTLKLGQQGEDGSVTSRTGDDGNARFDFLAARVATLLVRIARFQEVEQPLVLQPGQVTKADVLLARAPTLGAIRGIVLSDTGRYDEAVRIHLVQADPPDGQNALTLDGKVEWDKVREVATGRFAIEDVPAGRWRLNVSEDDWFEWEPRGFDVEPPLEGFQLRVHDAVPVADLVFHPRTEGGAPFQTAYELRLASGSATDYERSNGGDLLIPSFPIEKLLRWRIDAPGCAPAIGDWSGFVTEPAVEGREQRGARPALLLGWGELYRVTRSDNRRAIEGAAVLVDGREMGKTDKNGRVYVSAAAKPSSVTFRYRDWKLERKVDLNPPRRGSREMERSVRLQVPKPKAKK